MPRPTRTIDDRRTRRLRLDLLRHLRRLYAAAERGDGGAVRIAGRALGESLCLIEDGPPWAAGQPGLEESTR